MTLLDAVQIAGAAQSVGVAEPVQTAGAVQGGAGLTAVPIQVASEGTLAVAIAVFLGQVIAFVLACWIAFRTYDGYREAGGSRPALYWLAVGIVLLAAVPTALRFVLPTLAGADSLTTTLVTTSSEIAGLGAILYAVFGRP